MKNKFRYYVFTMLTFITMVNYIDRGAQTMILNYGYGWGMIGLFLLGWLWWFDWFFFGGIFQIKRAEICMDRSSNGLVYFEIATAFAGEIGIAVLEGLL